MTSFVDNIDALLPQTQCTRCGYPTCRDYAQAIAEGKADINQCPPGGEVGVRKLAELLSRPYRPLDPARGQEHPREAALIDEARCIGCMLCIQACPVDAIVGAAKRMHTILTEVCTGCELCVPPCPVDCIEMVELSALAGRGHAAAATLAAQSIVEMASIARPRFESRQSRLVLAQQEHEARLAAKAAGKRATLEGGRDNSQRDRKRAIIEAALERARLRRSQQRETP
jgi:electron transport complex protein RnfB